MSETSYAKTAKGHEEIKTRAGGLSLRMRQALIFVDGKRSIEDLRGLLQTDELPEMLSLLAEQGYIEPCALPEKAPDSTTITPADAAAMQAHEADLARKRALEMKKQEELEVARSLMSRM